MNLTSLLDVRPEVADAIRLGKPVVALESTLIAHGLPWPLNLQTAQAMEAEVRSRARRRHCLLRLHRNPRSCAHRSIVSQLWLRAPMVTNIC